MGPTANLTTNVAKRALRNPGKRLTDRLQQIELFLQARLDARL
jgi:hypothetical protein